MLSNLFGSKARVKILKIFLLNSEEKYYIRQLARDLKLQVNSVRRELENLEKFGILISGAVIKRGEGTAESLAQGGKLSSSKMTGRISVIKNISEKHEKKYYKANTNFILFKEVKSLIIKAQVLYGEDFFNKLKKAGNIKLLVLTGKFVDEPLSPVDLLIVGRASRTKLSRLIKELEKELGREVNFTLMSLREFKYRRDITDVFLYGILEGKKIIAVDEIGVII
jgi:DNA-binding transcriptional regulator YhcF (GntR family)